MTLSVGGDECPDLVAAEFMPLEAEPPFSLSHDLGLYQGCAVGAIQRDDQLDLGQGRGLERCLDEGSTEAYVGHPSQRDNTTLGPQLDARIDTLALSPTMFHEVKRRKSCAHEFRLGGMEFRL